MKTRKNITLSRKAIAAGERAARQSGERSLSAVIEKHLLSLSLEDGEDFSPYRGQPVDRAGDARFDYLTKRTA